MTGILRTVCLIAIGLFALVQTGCIAAVAGVAGAGAVAGYVYYNGLLYRDYRGNLTEAVEVVRKALAAQKFTIDHETTATDSVTIQTKTREGYTVRIHLDLVPGSVPGDGVVTRVGVRVGLSGDETVSARILDEIGRIVPSVTPMPPPTSSGVTNNPSITPIGLQQPIGPQTAAPPLAGPSEQTERIVPIPVTPGR